MFSVTVLNGIVVVAEYCHFQWHKQGTAVWSLFFHINLVYFRLCL